LIKIFFNEIIDLEFNETTFNETFNEIICKVHSVKNV